MREAFFNLGSQNFYFVRVIGSLAIIIGFALLINAVINTSDSWKALKDYPDCVKTMDPALPEYSQARQAFCQNVVYNVTGVQVPAESPIGNAQRVQVLLNSIIKICFGIAVIFFGVFLYRPFPIASKVQQWPQHKAQHKK